MKWIVRAAKRFWSWFVVDEEAYMISRSLIRIGNSTVDLPCTESHVMRIPTRIELHQRLLDAEAKIEWLTKNTVRVTPVVKVPEEGVKHYG